MYSNFVIPQKKTPFLYLNNTFIAPFITSSQSCVCYLKIQWHLPRLADQRSCSIQPSNFAVMQTNCHIVALAGSIRIRSTKPQTAPCPSLCYFTKLVIAFALPSQLQTGAGTRCDSVRDFGNDQQRSRAYRIVVILEGRVIVICCRSRLIGQRFRKGNRPPTAKSRNSRTRVVERKTLT
jgi:hypothetical protein